MSEKQPKNVITHFFENQRGIFQNLQDLDLERNEKRLRKVLEDENVSLKYPVPLFVANFLLWAFFLLFPIILLLDPNYYTQSSINPRNFVAYYAPLIMTVVIFSANQKFLVPRCIFKKHHLAYFVYNSLLMFLALFLREIVFFLLDRTPGEGVGYFFSTYCFSFVKGHLSVWTIITFILLVVLVCVISVFYNLVVRQVLRLFFAREQKRSELQYELDFLKNQLSPHFLFNTLNNISALIQIDPKRAENSMAKLSKLLRVMLYQTSDKTIALKDEVDILEKYAELEKLRLDESFDFKFETKLEDPNIQVAPLVAMPLMENAMKHSSNTEGNNFAHISIVQSGNTLLFTAENSNRPRKSNSKSSGLGLATFKKRLELLYPDKYEYKAEVVGDTYCTYLKLLLDSSSN